MMGYFHPLLDMRMDVDINFYNQLPFSQWTAIKPAAKKHFLISEVFSPSGPPTRLNWWKSKRQPPRLFRGSAGVSFKTIGSADRVGFIQ
jgi:hypothetical protein